jgi:hypothetical protein
MGYNPTMDLREALAPTQPAFASQAGEVPRRETTRGDSAKRSVLSARVCRRAPTASPCVEYDLRNSRYEEQSDTHLFNSDGVNFEALTLQNPSRSWKPKLIRLGSARP